MSKDFSKVAPLSELQRLRSYSRRKADGTRESWDETVDRVLYSPHLGLQVLGKFTPDEMALIDKELRERRGFGSARGLWVMGTQWTTKPENFNSLFNCTSTDVCDWQSFGDLMDLAMQGSGTGAVLEERNLAKLPTIINKLNVSVVGGFGDTPAFARREDTEILGDDKHVIIHVGDSRQGWVSSYQALLELSSDDRYDNEIDVKVDISDVRAKGAKLKGFGGVADPGELPRMFLNVAKTLNKAVGRKLNSMEVCLVIGDAAYAVVAGGIRRTAGMRQGSPTDQTFVESKDNLWIVDSEGNWKIDPERDSLRTANHTVVYHHKPTLDECSKSVRKQFYSGEGAIQYAPESIARANADLLDTLEKKQKFLSEYEISPEQAGKYLSTLAIGVISAEELDHRLHRYGLNPLTLAA